ncbi:MAG: hypothetical protein N3Z28_05235 [Synechococcaceae cyanobacterium MAG-AL2]|uniref:hypothetical protein n=1 Tax=Candidatus Regnicoccus frigidus TaxID=3074015 RepID=UPI002828A31A|nr:hypothetical protein [Candidatus Regnicoccus frigidus]MCT4367058.1 hypothetical protein [Candidatus Regnicoccus frigidus MAG-AL2]
MTLAEDGFASRRPAYVRLSAAEQDAIRRREGARQGQTRPTTTRPLIRREMT